MRRYTIRGRIVYDRKFHPFNTSDLFRIGKKIGVPVFRITRTSYQELLDALEPILEDDSKYQDTITYEPGGGTFGGGGASSEFGGRAVSDTIIIEGKD